MRKMIFFVNPKAGHSAMRENVLEIVRQFTQAGWDVLLHPTSGPGEITEVIAARGAEFDMIAAAGGDGTLNETVSGMMTLERRPVLGYLPSGTVNDVASTLGLSKNPMRAATDILTGKPVLLDVGRFDGRYFTYVAAFGAFSAVSYSTPQAEKKIWGRLAYLASGVKSIAEIHPIHSRFTINGQTYEDDLIYGMVCSTASVGGFATRIERELSVSLSDGLFEVILVKGVRDLAELNRLGSALLRRDFRSEQFYTFQAAQFEIAFDTPVAWTLDGEFGGEVTQAAITNCKRALRIMVPQTAAPPAKQAE